MEWTTDIESVLENIRINCVLLANEHKKNYFALKYILQFFRLPVIVLSGLNSIISIGFQSYLDQPVISIVNCFISLVCSIIGSIELYLEIQKRMVLELTSQQSYYLLSVDIYKNLSLSKERRPIPPKDYLERCFNEYVKLVESSNVLRKRLEDKLAPLPIANPLQRVESALELNEVL